LWVAKQGGATVYLFGTVHALKPGLKWETPKIATAFAESQELWLEADDADPKTVQPIVAQLGMDRAQHVELRDADGGALRCERRRQGHADRGSALGRNFTTEAVRQ